MSYFIKKLLLVNIFLVTFVFADFTSLMPKPKFLTPDKAFKVTVIEKDGVIKTNIKMADKIHLYKSTLHYKIVNENSFELTVKLPTAKVVDEQKIYRGDLKVDIPLAQIRSKTLGDYTLEVDFQGCSDAGICYQPIKKKFNFKGTKKAGFFSKVSSLAKSGNSDKIANALANESVWFILLLFFIAGLLMSLTPCILPMIPILSSIILQQANTDGEVKKSTALLISFVYVVSMATMYAIIGVVAGLLDFDLQANLNNPWVIVPVAGLFIALALSLFGHFELALPSSWHAKLNGMSDNAHGKGLVGTAIMGALSALLVGACTAPIISGAILFIVITGKAMLGGLALFVMGIGAGVPLLLVGAEANHLVPKPGGWMNIVSKFFGVLMLILALIMLSRLLPNEHKGDRGYSVERLTKEVKATHKPVIVDLYKAGCAACKELAEITFVDKNVKDELKKFTFIHIDITKYTDKDKALLKKYRLFGAPNIIFFDKNNNYLPQKTLTGFVKPKDMVRYLKSILLM